ncbi:MAG TPA: hypothetical protein VKR06_06905, partial [Ktedonosporobacter sp.]|nr:hypothetical protein [Ktedonosporobacter sp.]
GIRLGWLLFTMRRSLGESTAREEERMLGIRETTHTLTVLRALGTHVETWATWLEKWRKM